jgi:hypothetical protein
MNNDPKIGGILSIVSGVFGILSFFMCILMIIMFYYMSSDNHYPGFYPGGFPDGNMMYIMYIVYGLMGIFMALVGVLAIVGGSFALKTKYWGWALAGAIASVITFFPCGIAAIIFIAKSQPAFIKTQPVNPNQMVTPPSISNSPPAA